MPKEIYWTPLAKESYLEITQLLLNQWGHNELIHFENLIDHRLNQISSNPELAPSFIDSEFRKLVVHKNASIIYKNRKDLIIILLVWDNRMDPKKLLKHLKNK